jgi:hypothetical protein
MVSVSVALSSFNSWGVALRDKNRGYTVKSLIIHLIRLIRSMFLFLVKWADPYEKTN